MTLIFTFSATLEAKPSAEEEGPFVEAVLGTINEAYHDSMETNIKLKY